MHASLVSRPCKLVPQCGKLVSSGLVTDACHNHNQLGLRDRTQGPRGVRHLIRARRLQICVTADFKNAVRGLGLGFAGLGFAGTKPVEYGGVQVLQSQRYLNPYSDKGMPGGRVRLGMSLTSGGMGHPAPQKAAQRNLSCYTSTANPSHHEQTDS